MKNLLKRNVDSRIADFQSVALDKQGQKAVKGGENSIIVEEVFGG